VEDGVDGRAADKPEQASDHAAGALVQVAVEFGQRSRPVPVQPQTVFQSGDQSCPLWILGEWSGADHAEPAGDLLAAGAGQQSGAVQADPGICEGGWDSLAQVFQGVGCFCARAGPGVEVVQFVDGNEGDARVAAHAANRISDVGDVGAA